MNQYNNFQEQADAYLVGGLSGEEQAQFEALVASDPLLKAEFELQRDMVEGIRDARRVQLKNRLQQIPADALYQGAGLSSSMRWILGLSIGSVMLAGLVFYTSQTNEEISAGSIIALSQDSAKLLEEAEAKADAISQKIIEAEKAQEEVVAKETVIPKNLESLELKHDPEGDGKAAKKINKNKASGVGVAPSMVAPADPMGFAEPNIIEKSDAQGDAPAKMDVGSSTGLSSVPEVAIKEDGKHKFHYQYTGGKVFLYGEFDKVYELLEFNSKAGRSVVLYYNDSFYELMPSGSQILALKAIGDKVRIAELSAYRRRKVE